MGLRHGERWAAQGVGLGQAHEPLGLLQERCRPVRHQAWYAKFLFMCSVSGQALPPPSPAFGNSGANKNKYFIHEQGTITKCDGKNNVRRKLKHTLMPLALRGTLA